MFKRVERLVDWWIRTGAAQEKDREVLAYGADLALYTAASTGARRMLPSRSRIHFPYSLMR